MEPVTISFDGLNDIGQYVYPLVYALVSALFGAISHRHFGAAGRLLGGDTRESEGYQEKSRGRAHIVNGSVTGVLGLAAFIAALVTSIILFNHAVGKANPQIVNVTIAEPQFHAAYTKDIDKLRDAFLWYRHSYRQSQEELEKLATAMAPGDVLSGADQIVVAWEPVDLSSETFESPNLHDSRNLVIQDVGPYAADVEDARNKLD